MASNKKNVTFYNEHYYDDDINVANKLLQIKENADRRNIEFDLSFAHLKQILRRKTCYYTGRKFQDDPQHAMSVERIHNDRGYTDDNTVVVCTLINTLRNDLTLKELDRMVKQIKKHEKKRLNL